jgi:hypothetical protein
MINPQYTDEKFAAATLVAISSAAPAGKFFQ